MTKTCALTFDDGPNGNCTPALLDLLDKEHVPATFFLVGKHAEAEPSVVLDIVKRGHFIGNHTYSHADLVQMDLNAIRREIVGCQKSLQRLGITPTLFRPPWGRYNLAIERVATDNGMRLALWDTDSTLSHGTVLLHDGRSVHYDCYEQVRRTAQIIEEGKTQGFIFVGLK